jgi:microcin C transport system permease protein
MSLTYVVRRLLLMIPTLFGITIVSFVIINLAPGSPVEQRLQAIRFGGGMGGGAAATGAGASSQSETGVSQEVIDALNKQYGFDKPWYERYAIWVGNIVRLDFGKSFKFEEPVVDVIASKFPVSLTFGIVSLLLAYMISVPLGVLKAIRRGSTFDVATSVLLFVTYSLPSLVLSILLIVFLASPTYLGAFPLGGLYSDNYDMLSPFEQFLDRLHHMALPLLAYVFGAFTQLTILMQNSMLDVIKQDYVRTARAKGLSDQVVYMKHALRNALIPLATSMSGIFTVFFAGSIIIESVFSLDGMGLLSLTAVNSRDYNILMGLIFFQAVLFMVGRLFADFLYVLIDPRIEFN